MQHVHTFNKTHAVFDYYRTRKTEMIMWMFSKTTSEDVNKSGPMLVQKNFLFKIFFNTAKMFKQNTTNILLYSMYIFKI